MRTLLVTALLAGVIAAPAQAIRPVEEGGSLPAVNMQRLVLASQLDRYRDPSAHTAGAKVSVRRVQRALRAKGYKQVAVDGNFGAQTATAYAKWQTRSTGATGLGANGIPGETTLGLLGQGRFRVVRPVKVLDTNGSYRGVRVNVRTKRMLKAAARRIGPKCGFLMSQGSYSTAVDDSANTHAGGGAIDIDSDGLCGATPAQAVEALRAVGFAAWARTTAQGFTSDHLHAIAVGDTDMSTPISPGGFTAMDQVGAYSKDEDGLSYPSSAPQRRKLVLWEDYRRSLR